MTGRGFAARLIAVAAMAILCWSCTEAKSDPKAEAPPNANPPVEHVGDTSSYKVEDSSRFPIVIATEYAAAPELNVTGTVAPDISRNVPVISLAAGRVVSINAKLGDVVTKGQLLLRVQSADIANALSDYRQAVADETLARAQLDRAKLLYDNGATAQKDLEIAIDAEEKAKVTVLTTEEKLRVLGADQNNQSTIIDIHAPVSGVITDQQVTNASGVQGLSAPNPFTISDMSSVWVLCDVYENDLKLVHPNEFADVRLNAYPDRVFQGRISNIGPILDPNVRTAKVRLELRNPGMMRFGMFVTATFHGSRKEVRAAVPASAILHLHDRDWVYEPQSNNEFRRFEVTAGKMLPNNMQEIVAGIAPGDRVVKTALVLQNTVEQ
ncbi:MAG TPA: efflux RND transporter periplasmic adaptor subunit [Bryobacteraceae bacterium]|nr:efflux RND transporter periplasmic adaptor subunit [Bryobacteraceae bacterium]